MDPTTNPTATPTPNPEPPVGGPAPVNPVINPAANSVPAAPVIDAPAAPEGIGGAPVNPVITPSNPIQGSPVQGNPVFQPSGVAATDPIMMPEPAPEPDPVEEELKAPMKAADPVPGSIGSAVSGPASNANVAPTDNPFDNNPTMPAQNPAAGAAAQPAGAAGKGAMAGIKNKFGDKKTMMILAVIAGMVVLALVAILILQLMNGDASGSQASNTVNNNTVIEPETDNEDSEIDTEEGDTQVAAGEQSLNCTRAMTEAEIVEATNGGSATTGTISIDGSFSDGNLKDIAITKSVVYGGEDATPTVVDSSEIGVSNINASMAPRYYLTVDSAGAIDFSLDSIQKTYTSLDFTCELL